MKKASLTSVEQTRIISMKYFKNFPIVQTSLLFLSQPSVAHSESFANTKPQISRDPEIQISVVRRSFHRSFEIIFFLQ